MPADPELINIIGSVGENLVHWVRCAAPVPGAGKVALIVCVHAVARTQSYLNNKLDIAMYLLSVKQDLGRAVYLGEDYKGESILHIAIINKSLPQVEFIVKTFPELISECAVGKFFTHGQTCYYGELPLQ